jgi:hypothetical protein
MTSFINNSSKEQNLTQSQGVRKKENNQPRIARMNTDIETKERNPSLALCPTFFSLSVFIRVIRG